MQTATAAQMLVCTGSPLVRAEAMATLRPLAQKGPAALHSQWPAMLQLAAASLSALDTKSPKGSGVLAQIPNLQCKQCDIDAAIVCDQCSL